MSIIALLLAVVLLALAIYIVRLESLFGGFGSIGPIRTGHTFR
jgi:hypothetical protein